MSKDRFSIRKTALGFVGPEGRGGCHNCHNGAQPQGRERFSATDPVDCRKGSFLCHPYGICNHYVVRVIQRTRKELP